MIMEKIVAQAQLMGTGNKESIAGFDISRKCPDIPTADSDKKIRRQLFFIDFRQKQIEKFIRSHFKRL